MATVSGPERKDSTPHDTSGTRRAARGGVANLIGAGYSGIASFAVTALVARIATTSDAGVYFSALSVLLIAASLVELGVPVGFVYFLARYRGLGRTDLLRKALTAGAVPMLVLGVIVATVGVVFRDQLGRVFFSDAVTDRAGIMAIISITLVFLIVTDSVMGATRGLGVMRPTVIADKFVNPTVQLLALVLLAGAGWTGGDQMIWTRTVGVTAVAILIIPWLRRLLRRYPRRAEETLSQAWAPKRKIIGEFWRFTGPRALGQIAQVGIQRVDVVLVALWLGPVDAAVYAAATRFLVFGQLAANAIGTAVQPQISALTARGARAPLQHLYRTSTAWVMFATWPFYLTFIVQAHWLMRLFGNQYERGALVLQILSAAMLIATSCGAVDAVLLMAGRSTWTMINAWVALIVNVGLNIWLIPQMGILGATIAWVASILVNNLVPLVQVAVGIRVHPFGRITLSAAITPLILFGLLPWVVSLTRAGVWGAAGALVLGVAVYLPLLWRWRHTLELTEILRRRERRASAE